MIFNAFTNLLQNFYCIMINDFFLFVLTGFCFSDHEGGNVSAHAGHLVCTACYMVLFLMHAKVQSFEFLKTFLMFFFVFMADDIYTFRLGVHFQIHILPLQLP